MTDRELKRLSRAELLEMLIAISKENDSLREQLAETQQKLDDRNIAIEECGTMAEAVLRLNGVFEAAQNACQQYLENLQFRCGAESTEEAESEAADAESATDEATPAIDEAEPTTDEAESTADNVEPAADDAKPKSVLQSLRQKAQGLMQKMQSLWRTMRSKRSDRR